MHKLERQLRDLKVWTRFQRNCKRLNSSSFVFFDGDMETVGYAFDWEKSPEGYDFWDNINNKTK